MTDDSPLFLDQLTDPRVREIEQAVEPVAPAAVPAPPAPVSAVLPVNATAAAGGLPIGPIVPGTSAGAPGVQPPTLKPPPPQVNPFGDKWRQR